MATKISIETVNVYNLILKADSEYDDPTYISLTDKDLDFLRSLKRQPRRKNRKTGKGKK